MRTNPVSSYVVAWGEPPVVLRCGVTRPAELAPASASEVIEVNGVNWLRVAHEKHEVFTAVDRPVYVEVSIPAAYTAQLLSPLSRATAALAQVCQVPAPGRPAPPDDKLCTRRS